jgi:hypothetical protein
MKSPTKILSAALGLTPTMSKPSRAVQLKHHAVKMAPPGSHAALLRRLYSQGKDTTHADASGSGPNTPGALRNADRLNTK